VKDLLIWFVGYAAPSVATGAVIKRLPRYRTFERTILIHGALLFSICCSQFAGAWEGLRFPWHISMFSGFGYLAAVMLSVGMFGRIGFWYAVSALAQQITISSTSFILLSHQPEWVVIVLVIPFFVWCHDLGGDLWILRVSLLAFWGVCSILLFATFADVMVNASLHTLFGALLSFHSVLRHDFVRSRRASS
jgi:hypothetical protein